MAIVTRSTPISLPTVTQSAGWVRSTSSPPSSSGRSPRRVATHQQHGQDDQDAADDVGEGARAHRVGEADVEGAGVVEGDQADDGDDGGEAELRQVPPLAVLRGRGLAGVWSVVVLI